MKYYLVVGDASAPTVKKLNSTTVPRPANCRGFLTRKQAVKKFDHNGFANGLVAVFVEDDDTMMFRDTYNNVGDYSKFSHDIFDEAICYLVDCAVIVGDTGEKYLVDLRRDVESSASYDSRWEKEHKCMIECHEKLSNLPRRS
jgi:hypothetical protein